MKKIPFTNLLIGKVQIPGWMTYLQGRWDLIGAEVGVWQGENSDIAFQELHIKKLYCIDYYKLYPGYETAEEQICADGFTQKDYDRFKKQAKERLEKYPVQWIYKKSDVAWKELPKLLDFVYLDANHQTDYLYQDLCNYYPLLAYGGILAGHDCKVPSVITAVVRFCDRHNLKFEIKGDDWIIQT